MRPSAAILVVVIVLAPPLARGQGVDPPARVGRIAAVSGAVSFHLAGADRWERASINLPLSDGAALWTQPGASATVGVTGNRIVLDASTELDVEHLDDQAMVVTQPQGESYWRLAALPSGDSFTVQTPRGVAVFAAQGRYEVVSGDTDRPTEITVLEGSAKVTGLPAEVMVGANQTLSITGDGTAAPLTPTLRSAVRDTFLQRVLAAERPPAHRAPLPPAVALMTGADALADTGEWADNPAYGAVWYPPAPSGYVPYRDGHWAYVAPWGWTWVDDAPWGFAPTHYGRWADIDGRWGWVPGQHWAPERPPVYAPALVGFVAGAAAGSWVGWAPLGPREEYWPPYQVSQPFLQRLNQPTGASGPITIINRNAVTVVPVQAMVSSANVGRVFRPAPQLPSGPEAIQFRPPVAPTHATVGATAAVIHETGGPARPPAPGPAIGPAIQPPGHVGPASLVGGAAAAGAAAALLHQPPRPGMPELRPHGGLPAAAPGVPFARPPVGPAVPAANAPLRPSEPRPSDALPGAAFPGRPAPGPIPQQPRLAEPRPGEPRPGQIPRVEAPRPAPAPRPDAPRFEPPRPEAVRPESPRFEPRRAEPPPRAEAPRAPMARPEPPRMPPPPRVEAARPPPPHIAPPRPEPRPERPAPQRSEPPHRPQDNRP